MTIVLISLLVSVTTLFCYDYYKDNEAYERQVHKLLEHKHCQNCKEGTKI
jgi:hypothetical protein